MRFITVLMIAALAAGSTLAQAAAPAPADYPNRPLRLITGFLPGGISDTLARIVGENLGERLGQRVVIDGRPGAGGMISLEIAATATADGHTLLLGTPAVTISPSFKRKLAFDPLQSFAAVTMLGSSPTIAVVHPAVAANSVTELIALAKSRPGQINYASSGQGTTNHLAGELLKAMAGVQITHVPYKGAALTLLATISGETQLTFSPLLPAIPHVKSGKLKGIAVTSARRSTALPELPAVAETLPGYDVTSWYAILVPAKTPQAIVARLNSEINKVLATPEVRERLSAQGVEVAGSSSAELAAFIKTDAVRWAKLVKDAGIRLE
jgi:tripartite-type tricarboxylate transporter receptor subunit TctC